MKVPSVFSMRKSMWMTDFFRLKLESMDFQAREKLCESIKQRLQEAYEKTMNQYVIFDWRDILEGLESDPSLLPQVVHFIPHIPFDCRLKELEVIAEARK
jgi:hypothetical protein